MSSATVIKVSGNSLTGKICAKAQSMPYPVVSSGSGLYAKEARAKKAVVRQAIRWHWPVSKAMTELESGFAQIRYASPDQATVRLADAKRDVERYITYEAAVRSGRSTWPTPTVSIIIPDGAGKEYKAVYAPDFLFHHMDGETLVLEAATFSSGRPSFTQRGAANGSSDAIRILLNILWAAKVSGGVKRHVRIVGSQYWLRRKDDRAKTVSSSGHYDSEFYSTGGGNIVNLVIDSQAELDALLVTYSQAIKDVFAGVAEEECKPEDCAECPYFDCCKYELPPMAVKAVRKRSAAMMIPSASQMEAINADEGVIRINAGPGAGKTYVVVQRVLRMLDEGVEPKAIMMVSFTDAAAKEMKARIVTEAEDAGMDCDLDALTVTTFNSFGNAIVHAEWASLGFSEEPRLVNAIERKRIISRILLDNPDPLIDMRNFDANDAYVKGPVYMAEKIFTVMKADNLMASDYPTIWSRVGWIGASQKTVEAIARLYDKYDETLRASNLIEFADQEALVFEVLHMNPLYFDKFGLEHIIIDEFQDTSPNQMEIVKNFIDTPSFKSLMVVGDDSQAIYGFRGTTPEFMINFAAYVGCPVRDINLLENHRSTPEIVDFANKINDFNKKKIMKTLIATRRSIGKPVTVKGFLTSAEEYEFIINKIKDYLTAGVKPEDIAFIAYKKSELMKMAGLLRTAGIPSVMLNPEPLVENGRVRAAIAFIAALQNPNDGKNLLSFANGLEGGGLLDKPKAYVDRAVSTAKKRILGIRTLPEKAKRHAIDEVLQELDRNDDEVYHSFIDSLSYERICRDVFDYCSDFYKFGQQEAYRRNAKYPGIALTTAHSSKGLEWPIVINSLSSYDSEDVRKSNDSVEERRRLLYVSATRARNELTVTGTYDAFVRKDPDNPKIRVHEHNEFLGNSYSAVEKSLADDYAEDSKAAALKKALEKQAEKAKEAKAKVDALLAAGKNPDTKSASAK